MNKSEFISNFKSEIPFLNFHVFNDGEYHQIKIQEVYVLSKNEKTINNEHPHLGVKLTYSDLNITPPIKNEYIFKTIEEAYDYAYNNLFSNIYKKKDRQLPKFNVGDYVVYQTGDLDIQVWNGKVIRIVDLGNEYAYRIDAYSNIGSAKDSNIVFDSEKNNEQYEAVLRSPRMGNGGGLIYNGYKELYQKKQNNISKESSSFEGEGSQEGRGKLYEFFTPQIVADKMLSLAQHYGFSGGNVLEPAAGNGRLLKHLTNSKITAFEISENNYQDLKRNFPDAELYNFNFEKAFLKAPRYNDVIDRKATKTWLKNAPFDLVLANPPYGEFSGIYSSYFNFKGQFEQFFILQTLKLLKSGGIGVYLIPSNFMRNGISYNEVKKQIFEMAELKDAYRLPINAFKNTQIGTDIIVLKKK